MSLQQAQEIDRPHHLYEEKFLPILIARYEQAKARPANIPHSTDPHRFMRWTKSNSSQNKQISAKRSRNPDFLVDEGGVHPTGVGAGDFREADFEGGQR